MTALAHPRVLHVTQPVDAGVAHVVRDLLEDQLSAGWEVSLVSPPGWLASRAGELGVRWSPWSARRSPGAAVPAETRQLARLLGEHGPELVHLHSSKAGLAGRLAIRGRLPTVFQPHAWSFAAAGRLQGRAAVAWERTAGARWTTLQLCCSPEEQEQGRQAGVPGRSVVARNGVDLRRFAPVAPAARTQARELLGLSADTPVAICVGRLSRQKGQDVALAAWRAVTVELPEARLLLAGDGPDRGALEATAGHGVHVLGHRTDVDVLLAAADLALLPSRWEGLALALLEAMARGLPVVATDVGGSRSTLLHGSLPVAGAVIPIDDPTALAAQVSRRLRDPQLRLAEGAAARRRVERDHDLRSTTRYVRDVCATVLADSDAPG